ncbi:MAG: hypothetical protein HRT81_02215 [Henriciella sp.]|nr:hypothetical protein [Henriciella sp.]
MVLGRGAVAIVWLGMLSFPATASQIHTLRFVQPEQVLVWQSGAFIGQGALVPVSRSQDTTEADWAGSGQLLPITKSASHPAQSVKLDIASNAGFVIKLKNSELTEDVQVEIVGVGVNAKRAENISSTSRDEIYRQNQKTAQRPGAPETQTLSFELTWSGEIQPDFEVIALAP